MCFLSQSFSKTFIVSIRSKITIDLRRKVLDNSMKDGPTTSADDILKTLSDVYKESMDKQTAVQPEEEMAPGEKNAPTESTKPRDVVRIKARSKKKKIRREKSLTCTRSSAKTFGHWV